MVDEYQEDSVLCGYRRLNACVTVDLSVGKSLFLLLVLVIGLLCIIPFNLATLALLSYSRDRPRNM